MMNQKKSAAEQLEALLSLLESLRANYQVRAEYSPEPSAKWADIEADLRAVLNFLPGRLT